jgi:hypothetical protein
MKSKSIILRRDPGYLQRIENMFGRAGDCESRSAQGSPVVTCGIFYRKDLLRQVSFYQFFTIMEVSALVVRVPV